MTPRNPTSRQPANNITATVGHTALVAAVVDSVVLALGLDALDIDRFMPLHEDLSRAVESAINDAHMGRVTVCTSDDD